jgi:hypothetical protein
MITPQAAEALLRAEIAANSVVGQALLAWLHDAEIDNYRQSTKTNDPYMMARICGRGEGLHSLIKRITPVQEPAHPGRVSDAAERKAP